MGRDVSKNTRREVLVGLGALTAATAVVRADTMPSAPDMPALPVRTLRGRVVEACGQERGASDHVGIWNVMVSNGRDVVTTDRFGAWALDVRTGDNVFVIKPPHWTYEQRVGIPQFCWRVDEYVSAIDFILERNEEDDVFEVALVADTQAANETELGYVGRELARSLMPGSVAFAINHGDVMGDDLTLFSPYTALLKTTGCLWHHCPGNHDMDLSAPNPARAFDTWKREIGPTHYAFQYAKTTFILLSNVEYLGAGAEPIDGRLYRGRIGREQLDFVRNVLKFVPRDDLVVVSMHVPLVSFEDPDAPGDNTSDRAQLLELLADRPHTVSFSGHSHTTEHHYLAPELRSGAAALHHHHVLTAFCGSWWSGPLNSQGIPISDSRDGSPRGYHILRVDGNRYETRFVPVGDAEVSSIRHAVACDGACADLRALTVDIFDGGPRTRVRCVLPGGAQTRELVRAAIPDPHIVETYARHRAMLKPWVVPAMSSHIWTASLPAAIVGECILDITNEYGLQQRFTVTV